MREFEVCGMALSARERRPAGRVRGVVLALHGGGYTGGYWDFAPTSLLEIAARRGYLAVAIDRPGYGVAYGHPMALDQQADIVLDLVEQLRAIHGSLPVLLAGHSMGGILTLMVAARPRAADLLTALDVCGVPLRFPEAQQQAMLSRKAEPGETHFPVGEIAQRRAMFYGHDGTFDAEAMAYDETISAPVPCSEFIDATHAPMRLPSVMRAITLPVRMTFAEVEGSSIADAKVAAAAKANLAGSRKARVRFEPACGHNISLSHAGTAFHEAMIDWLEENLSL